MARSGKEGSEFMEKVVYPSLGSGSRKVVVGPGRGLDNAVVRVGDGRVMIVTVDPVSVVPAMGAELSARLSVHLIASDIATSGADPEYATFSYNFPPEMKDRERTKYVRALGAECGRLGISIIAGNTGTYPGGGYTVVGAGTMIGFAGEGGYVTPSMARTGDDLLMTKHAAIEAAASLAFSFPEFVERQAGAAAARKARSLVNLCTTVADARAGRGAGLGEDGVTSMHDATEGGVLGGLDEMASASRKEFVVDPRLVPVSREAAAVCSAFGLDPLETMGEGALLITCRPQATPTVGSLLRAEGIEVTRIGGVREGSGLTLARGAGRPRRYRGGRDPYWSAYEVAERRRLR